MNLKEQYVDYVLNDMSTDELKSLARDTLLQRYMKRTDYDMRKLISAKLTNQLVDSL